MNLEFEKLYEEVDALFEGKKSKKNKKPTNSGKRWGPEMAPKTILNKKDDEKKRSTRRKAERDAMKGVYESKKEDPCWDGYKQVGTKKKKGKEVPNCVPVEESKCTGPTKKASSTSKGKKWMQCVKNPDGKGYKRVHWGQKGVRVTGKSGDTKRKKSFRARHKCSSAKAGTANYQSCKDW